MTNSTMQAPAVKLTRAEQAKVQAEEICEDFQYTQLVTPNAGAGTVEVWRCMAPGDFDHAHDLVVTRMGICAFGDMDPLVFRVGADYGLKYLAQSRVDTLFGKLDEGSRSVEVDHASLYLDMAHRVASHFSDFISETEPGEEARLGHAILTKELDKLKQSNLANAEENLKQFLTFISSQMGNPALAADPQPDVLALRDLLDNIEGDYSVDSVAWQIEEADMGDDFDDINVHENTVPALSVLTRLHVLSIGAQRILALQQEKQEAVEHASPAYESPRG